MIVKKHEYINVYKTCVEKNVIELEELLHIIEGFSDEEKKDIIIGFYFEKYGLVAFYRYYVDVNDGSIQYDEEIFEILKMRSEYQKSDYYEKCWQAFQDGNGVCGFFLEEIMAGFYIYFYAEKAYEMFLETRKNLQQNQKINVKDLNMEELENILLAVSILPNFEEDDNE